jgi:hypothetical protein
MSAPTTDLPLGVIVGEPFGFYHGCAAVGSHDLADLEPYPLLFFQKHISREVADDHDTPAMAFGRYFHALALEGEDVAAERFAVKPEGIDRRTTAGKAAFAAFEADAGGKQIITSEDYDLAWRMLASIREKSGVRALFASGSPEVTFRHKMDKFTVQCRADWYDEKAAAGPCIIDVKTIEHLEDFDFQFDRLNYFRQAAFYVMVASAVLKIDAPQIQHVFVVVEKNPPFQTAVRAIDAASLQVGQQEVVRLLQKLKACHESGIWPGEPDAVRPVSLPQRKLTASLT